MKVIIHKIALVIIMCFASEMMYAQTPPPPTPPPGAPIDGGVVAMFFVALILGYVLTKKYFITKKSSL